jgi:hypothetical protein
VRIAGRFVVPPAWYDLIEHMKYPEPRAFAVKFQRLYLLLQKKIITAVEISRFGDLAY